MWVWRIIRISTNSLKPISPPDPPFYRKWHELFKDGCSILQKMKTKKIQKVRKLFGLLWALYYLSAVRQLCKEDKRTTGILRDKYNDASIGLARGHMSTPAA